MARKTHFDAAEVRAKTLDHIAKCKAKAEVHEKVVEVLKAYQGKIITKRLASEVKKALGDKYVVYWKTELSWSSLSIWNNDTIPYGDRYDAMIAYDNDLYPTKDRRFDFAYWQERYGNAHGLGRYAETAAESEAALRTLDEKVAAYNAAVEAADAAYEGLKGLAVWS